jgi:RNA polymerase sigma-70 factor, ECF subfamily
MSEPVGMQPIAIEHETREAFQELAKEQLPALYSLARRLVGDGAEDLVQETLVRGYRAFGGLNDARAAGAWLKSILVNVFRDGLRRKAHSVDEVPVEDLEGFSLYRRLIEADPLPYSDSLHVDFLRSFDAEDVRAVLMALPEIYRAPLVLHHMDGFSTKEIARLLDVPIGTVLARLHRGRKRFERELWSYAERTELLLRKADGS